jgi:hypothetical protein
MKVLQGIGKIAAPLVATAALTTGAFADEGKKVDDFNTTQLLVDMKKDLNSTVANLCQLDPDVREYKLRRSMTNMGIVDDIALQSSNDPQVISLTKEIRDLTEEAKDKNATCATELKTNIAASFVEEENGTPLACQFADKIPEKNDLKACAKEFPPKFMGVSTDTLNESIDMSLYDFLKKHCAAIKSSMNTAIFNLETSTGDDAKIWKKEIRRDLKDTSACFYMDYK